MRLKITLRFPPDRGIPIHYNYWLQSALYKAMGSETGIRVHDQGFTEAGRVFRYFTFSRLLGRFELSRDRKFIYFPEGCQWVVSSPLNDILGAMAGGILRTGVIEIGPEKAEITEVRVENPVIEGGAVQAQANDEGILAVRRIRVRTLSPVVAYSTMLKADGNKYTVYFQPGEAEFQRIVSENLDKKAAVLKKLNNVAPEGGENEDDRFRVRTIGQPRLHIIQYKGGIIKGYSSLLELHGSKPLLQLALDAGLGSKNAQGFGCLEVI